MTTIATRGPSSAIWTGRLVQASADFVRPNSGARLLGITLATYAVLWLLYFSVSNVTVDVHSDVSEASVWARTFSLGYKHPPMMAWIFRAWLAVFPRTDWAAYLLAVANLAATLAIIWVILRDHLDKERALVGVMALILVPFYTFLASRLNANTVMMPFWAATVLFYLRARRNARWGDAVLAGVFAGLTFLGKYWGVYLVAGIAVASFAGEDLKRFWRSGAPFLMGAAALVVLAPHIRWLLTEHDHPVENYLTTTVMVSASFGSALKTSAFYLGGLISYVVMPLIFSSAEAGSRGLVGHDLANRSRASSGAAPARCPTDIAGFCQSCMAPPSDADLGISKLGIVAGGALRLAAAQRASSRCGSCLYNGACDIAVGRRRVSVGRVCTSQPPTDFT